MGYEDEDDVLERLMEKDAENDAKDDPLLLTSKTPESDLLKQPTPPFHLNQRFWDLQKKLSHQIQNHRPPDPQLTFDLKSHHTPQVIQMFLPHKTYILTHITIDWLILLGDGMIDDPFIKRENDVFKFW